MCSPGGRATINSLMKVATFLFEITSHSHSFTPRTDSGTTIFMSFFTFTWQPSRQWFICCLREKCTCSVGRISPPPSRTWQRHCPHEPPPPQAEGRNIFSLARVLSRLPPVSTSTFLSSLMVMTALPDGTRYFLAMSRITTSRSDTPRNKTILDMIVVDMELIANNIVTLLLKFDS